MRQKPHSSNRFQAIADVSEKLAKDLDRLVSVLARVGSNEMLSRLQEQSLRLKEHLVVLKDLTQPDDETEESPSRAENENRENTRKVKGASHH